MRSPIIIFCLLVSVCAACGGVSRIDTKITIDGKLDEQAWKDCKEFQLGHYRGGKLSNPTTLKVAYDSENLYVAFICNEKQMDKTVNNWSHVEERDNNIWNDDCVEILLDPWGTRQKFYQIIVNMSGVVYDSFERDTFWDGDLDIATKILDDRWIVEMSIAFKELGFAPKGGETWLGNFCREEKPHRENSSLFKASKGFTDKKSFGPITFDTDKSDVAFMLKQFGRKKITADIRNNTENSKKLCISLRDPQKDSQTVFKRFINIKPSQAKTISFPVKIPSEAKNLNIEVKDNFGDEIVYSNRIRLIAAKKKTDMSSRVWNIEKPLYSELMSDEPMGFAKDGTMFWQHGLNYGPMRQFAHQYGLRYVYEEYFKLMADNKLLPITSGYMLTVPSYDAVSWYRKYGIKGILFAERRKGSEFKIGRYPFFSDPEVGELFAKSTDKYLDQYSDVLWAVSAGDEIYEHDEKTGIKLLATPKNKYEFIGQADQEVKNKYGGGIYGIPTGLKDKNPYRWIAYRKWMNDRYAETFKKFYKNVKSKNPNLKVFSMDPIAFHHPYDFSRASEYCDIVTHQLYPRRNANFAKFGFLTKLLVDLSGLEVWPCAHVEEYAASFTPQEVVELISQIFRNGGSGLHYFLADTIGRRAKKKHMVMEYYGAPDRWQTEMALAAEISKMNKLKFPNADCAILYSCDSRASQPSGTPSDEFEIAYTLLGPNAGSWFKFIDDNQVDRGTVNLSDYKVLYIPFATYQRRSVVEKLTDYVKAGGIIVCGDPLAFSYDIHGKTMNDAREKLLGVKECKQVNAGKIIAGKLELPVMSRAYKIKTVVGTRVLNRFKHGLPAITLRRFGKGKVYYFAVNPFAKKTVGIDSYKKYFKKLQKQLGLKTDHDIWRFQFPMSLIKNKPAAKGKCLTGNYIYWQSFNPLSVGNVELKGTYSYSIAPDRIGDQGGVKDILFANGDLTDRRKAPTAGNVDLKQSKLQDWIVQYKKLDPFSVTFDLTDKFSVQKIKLFYSHGGVRPEIKVEGSVDGATWKSMGSVSQLLESAKDVRDVDIKLSGDPVRYLRVNFGQREEGNYLTLSELEIWAK